MEGQESVVTDYILKVRIVTAKEKKKTKKRWSTIGVNLKLTKIENFKPFYGRY